MNSYVVLLVLVGLFSACSGPEEHSATSNTNATPQANNSPAQANSNAAPPIAKEDPPLSIPGIRTPAVQPIPPPAAPVAAGNANVANAPNPAATANARLPKLVIAGNKIDFGKQPQGKTLVRPIVVRNGGRADLNIESVVPS